MNRQPTLRKSLTGKVLKAMSIFSSLQVVGILASVAKAKLVAIWLGPTGVGLFGIYQSVNDNISTLSDMGLRQSAVRDVAASAASPSRLSVIAAVVRRWSLLAGLFSAILIMGLSPALGEWFFYSPSQCWGFALLAIALLLNSLCGGEQALLQGTSRLKALAKGNLWGTLAGLAVSIPMFYYMRQASVAPSFVAYAAAMYISMRVRRVKTKTLPQPLTLQQVWREGTPLVRMGLCMAGAAFVTSSAHTLFIALVNSLASTQTVGLVQAGDTIIVRYIGLAFTAIGMEFYPRLAAARHRRAQQAYVSHEAGLLVAVLTPLLAIFLLLRTPVVNLLYSPEFTAIVPFISWGAISAIPKALSWCMAFTIVARGDGGVYILTETLDALLSVPLCLWALLTWGMAGLGLAYIAWYLLYTLIAGTVYYRRYGMRLPARVWCMAAASMLLLATINFMIS